MRFLDKTSGSEVLASVKPDSAAVKLRCICVCHVFVVEAAQRVAKVPVDELYRTTAQSFHKLHAGLCSCKLRMRSKSRR